MPPQIFSKHSPPHAKFLFRSVGTYGVCVGGVRDKKNPNLMTFTKDHRQKDLLIRRLEKCRGYVRLAYIEAQKKNQF